MKGDPVVVDALLLEILPRLHQIALRELTREHQAPPLSKTELIHELWLRNLSKGGWPVRDRGHFYAMVSRAMRQVLVDLARNRMAARRGGGDPAGPFEDSLESPQVAVGDTQQIVDLGILMDRLEEKDAEAALVLDMVYFTGFTLEETARETGLTLKQVRARWKTGIEWLKKMNRVRPRVASTS